MNFLISVVAVVLFAAQAARNAARMSGFRSSGKRT
nr:MAG TPA: UPF0130 protein [Caudoviricetes sp.]